MNENKPYICNDVTVEFEYFSDPGWRLELSINIKCNQIDGNNYLIWALAHRCRPPQPDKINSNIIEALDLIDAPHFNVFGFDWHVGARRTRFIASVFVAKFKSGYLFTILFVLYSNLCAICVRCSCRHRTQSSQDFKMICGFVSSIHSSHNVIVRTRYEFDLGSKFARQDEAHKNEWSGWIRNNGDGARKKSQPNENGCLEFRQSDYILKWMAASTGINSFGENWCQWDTIMFSSHFAIYSLGNCNQLTVRRIPQNLITFEEFFQLLIAVVILAKQNCCASVGWQVHAKQVAAVIIVDSRHNQHRST